MVIPERIFSLVGAVVVLLLQVLLAPHISIGYALPNFVCAFCLVMALVHPRVTGPVYCFILGLAFDFVSGGPLGAMAFVLTLVSTFESWLFLRANNDTRFMAITVLVGCVFACEILYGGIFLLFGYSAGVLEAFVMHSLPCFIYDFIIALVMLLLMLHMPRESVVTRTEIKQL